MYSNNITHNNSIVTTTRILHHKMLKMLKHFVYQVNATSTLSVLAWYARDTVNVQTLKIPRKKPDT